MRDARDLTSDSLEEAFDGLAQVGSFVSRPDRILGEQPGDVIDRYRLLELVGEGGMGEVWLAEQQEPIRRQVALKILKLGMDTKRIVARFEAERQALAMMDHPNIAKIHDGGATSTGRPYFVMEYVDGLPLTTYVREEKPTFEERVRLLIDVCVAIQHAHDKGIIHRDIKPSNVLIVDIEGQPVPKVIDFGIAKAADVSLTDRTAVTGFGQILGTLGYMSPEQAAVDPSGVDSRSDVYSLGVLLYEVATGQHPFDLKKVRTSSMDEALRILREEQPKRPSARSNQSVVQVPSEFDWIALKALEKESYHRYQTARDLGADLERLLQNRPIEAHPPSSSYRLKKWLVRHRLVVGVVSLLLVATVGSWWLTDWTARKTSISDWSDRLLSSETSEVGLILQENPVMASAAVPEFQKHLRDHPVSTKRGLHARLALAPSGNKPSEVLVEYMLSNAGPDEIAAICQQLAEHRQSLVAKFSETLKNHGSMGRGRALRASAGLAAFEPGHALIREHRGNIARWLANEKTAESWAPLFLPVASHLIPELRVLFTRSEENSQGAQASVLLAKYLAPLEIAELVREARPQQLPTMMADLRKGESAVVGKLQEMLAEDFRSGPTEEVKDRLALGQARAGMALVLMGQWDQVLPYLERSDESDDPRLRTFLIHAFADYGVEPQLIMEQTRRPGIDPHQLSALLLSLGDYALPASTLVDWQPFVEDLVRNHEHRAVHGAAVWLWDQWYDEDVPVLNKNWIPEQPGDWYISPEGMTMIVFRGPIAFTMGAAMSEPARFREHGVYGEIGRQHTRVLPRTFAMASKLLSYEQFERKHSGFMQSVKAKGLVHKEERVDLSTAVGGIQLQDALEYCNWLSGEEGFPEAQHCFEQSPSGDELVPKKNFLSLLGYRLPTDAEWEYVCRAGTVTPRYFGNSESLLTKYEWVKTNAQGHSWPAGLLRPNDFGMFDMLGNVYEWVHGCYVATPPGERVVDVETEVSRKPSGEKRVFRLLRGSIPSTDLEDVRCSRRKKTVPTIGLTKSIRLARTLSAN